ncbi:hypothetical protein EDB85DRAFT_2219638, partial [Lactarius pseudohatsudake]
IYGQGGTGKTRAKARLRAAFDAENHQREFDWDEAYGEGFVVLHFPAYAGELAGRGTILSRTQPLSSTLSPSTG